MACKKLALFLACSATLLPLFAYCDDAQIASLDKQIAELQAERTQAKRQAYIAGSNADQYLGQNWTDYRRALIKQEAYQHRVKELDAKIAELEKQKSALEGKAK